MSGKLNMNLIESMCEKTGLTVNEVLAILNRMSESGELANIRIVEEEKSEKELYDKQHKVS